jgi:DNA (cytosine-5)-methyltransferase 1
MNGSKKIKKGEGKFKILNLYACLGGNRYKWDEVAKQLGIEIEVTAVEIDPLLAELYQERFPNDIVIVGDAHQYLLDHYSEYNFVWTSTPCPTHSRANYWGSKTVDARTKYYPDMSLYQEIIFLDKWFNGLYCVENVIPYYEPLIKAEKRGRHLYWCNFKLPAVLSERTVQIGAGENEVKKLCEFHDFDFYKYAGGQRRDKIARNLVDYEAGKTILSTALGIIKQNSYELPTLF